MTGRNGAWRAYRGRARSAAAASPVLAVLQAIFSRGRRAKSGPPKSRSPTWVRRQRPAERAAVVQEAGRTRRQTRCASMAMPVSPTRPLAPPRSDQLPRLLERRHSALPGKVQHRQQGKQRAKGGGWPGPRCACSAARFCSPRSLPRPLPRSPFRPTLQGLHLTHERKDGHQHVRHYQHAAEPGHGQVLARQARAASPARGRGGAPQALPPARHCRRYAGLWGWEDGVGATGQKGTRTEKGAEARVLPHPCPSSSPPDPSALRWAPLVMKEDAA